MSSGTIVVTGGSGDIGAAIATAAASSGLAVCVNYQAGGSRAERVVDQIRASGGRATAYRADVRCKQQVQTMFAAVSEEHGQITGLVNNAGIIGGRSRVEDLAPDVLRTVLEVNVVGSFICAAEAIRYMSPRAGGHGGAIVNVSSRAAKLGGSNEWVHYAASKGAVDTFTVGLAQEVAAQNIRVNAVNPGLIDTGIHAASGDADRLRRLQGTIPLGRAGSIGDVAEAVLFLLSPRASYITGICLDVSGGR